VNFTKGERKKKHGENAVQRAWVASSGKVISPKVALVHDREGTFLKGTEGN